MPGYCLGYAGVSSELCRFSSLVPGAFSRIGFSCLPPLSDPHMLPQASSVPRNLLLFLTMECAMSTISEEDILRKYLRSLKRDGGTWTGYGDYHCLHPWSGSVCICSRLGCQCASVAGEVYCMACHFYLACQSGVIKDCVQSLGILSIELEECHLYFSIANERRKIEKKP